MTVSDKTDSSRSWFTQWGLLVFGAIVYLSFVVWQETSWRDETAKRVIEHAQAIAPSLVSGDEQGGLNYLTLAARSYGYEKIEVHTLESRAFWAIQGSELTGLDALFDPLGVLTRLKLTSVVAVDGNPIGSMEVVAISRTIYGEIYMLFCMILVLFLISQSARVWEGKKLLEGRVAIRTKQLEKSETQLRHLVHLLDLSPDIIFVREPDGEMSYFNKGATSLWDVAEVNSRLEEIYRSAREMDSSDELTKAGLWVGEISTRLENGRTVTLHASLSLAIHDHQQIDRVLVIATNVSSQKSLERRLQQVQRAQIVGTMASGIAHNFNNLLNPILLSSQFLQEKKGRDEKELKMLEVMESCAKRGADLVRRLLDLSGNSPVQRRAVLVGLLLRDIEEILDGTMPKSIDMVFDYPAGELAISGDPTDLHQAILNVCLNARDAMPKGGCMTVSVTVTEVAQARLEAHQVETGESGWVCILISDTGEGIAAADRVRVFEPFYTTKDVAGGTGLGLATVQTIVRNHGGFIELTSAKGEGTCFGLYLPLGEHSDPPVSEPDHSSLKHGEGTVLLVDDEEMILESSALLLEELGYDVVAVSSGRAALKAFSGADRKFDALVTDIMMPEMDGVTLIECVLERDQGMPIVVMTGMLSPEHQDRLETLGIKKVVAKPFSISELENALASAMSSVSS